MASFDPNVPAVNPQSFLNNSQGTDRAQFQPLAESPRLSEKYVQPDYRANTSIGQGLKGLGELGDSAIKLTDQVIQQNVDDTLHKGIDSIRDSFGVAQAADQSTGLAKAAGQAGTDGVSLTENDPNAGQPVAVNRLGNRIEGLTEAYKQGALSNSAYYAKMEAYVREVKAQFPGYGDIIDQKVSGIVGTTPANALRSSLLQDVTNLQNKVQQASDKWTSYEQKNAGYIYQQWPDYDKLKAQGQAPSRVDVETVVGRLAARDAIYSSQSAALAAKKGINDNIAEEAKSIATNRAMDIGNGLVVSTTNAMGMRTPQDFQKLADDINSGKRQPLTPDEVAQVRSAFAQMKQQYDVSFRQFISSPLSQNSSETMASKLGKPELVTSIHDQGMQNLKDIEDGLINGQHGLITAAANDSAARNSAAENSFLRNDPNAALAGAVRKQYGDTGMAQLFLSNPPLATSQLEGLRMAGWNFLASGKSSAVEGLATIKKESGNDGTVIKAHLGDAANTIIHADKMADPTLAPKAVQYLFGPNNRTLIDSFQTKSQIPVFNDLVSHTMTQAVKKMDQNSQNTYVQGVDEMFQSVFNTQIDNANQSSANYKINGNLKVVYDPDAVAFRYERTGRATPQGFVDAANRNTFTGINSAMHSMLEVFKMQNRDPTAELYRLLPISGIEPGTPMYKAIQEEYIKKNPPSDIAGGRAGNRYDNG